jgi:hypothetical protein
MGRMGAGQFSREIRERNEPLGTGIEVLHVDLPIGEFVADDDGEVGMRPCSTLELLRELALA